MKVKRIIVVTFPESITITEADRKVIQQKVAADIKAGLPVVVCGGAKVEVFQ